MDWPKVVTNGNKLKFVSYTEFNLFIRYTHACIIAYDISILQKPIVNSITNPIRLLVISFLFTLQKSSLTRRGCRIIMEKLEGALVKCAKLYWRGLAAGENPKFRTENLMCSDAAGKLKLMMPCRLSAKLRADSGITPVFALESLDNLHGLGVQ